MTDALGYRAKFGVLMPSTNTIVGPDYSSITVPGVTSHPSRIHIRDQNLSSNERFKNLIEQIWDEVFNALDRVCTADIDYLVMGMSAGTFWNGIEGSNKFIDVIEKHSGLKVATGSHACRAALETLGAKNIAILTPYQKIADENVCRFFRESGFSIADIHGLRCPNAISIAHFPEDRLRQTVLDLNKPGVDAILQVGTNLSMVKLAAELEVELSKPVIAINTATWWYALRQNGFEDKLSGFGSLLESH